MTDWYKIKRILTWINWEEKQIYPATWHPWANTVAYYPIETNVNDYSWNSKNMTNNGVAFGTYAWVQCWYFDNNSYASRSWSLFTWNPTFTVSIWMNNISRNWWEVPWSFGSNLSTNSFLYWISDSRKLNIWWYSNDRDTWYTINTNTWYNVIFAYNPSWWDVYVNWSKVYTWTWSPTIWNNTTRISGDQWNWQNWYWYLSKLIFEDRKWTATDVTNYYNATKSTYWY